jgi:adenine-specific DNA-methyltransferase
MAAKQPRKPKAPLGVEDIVHTEAKRKNIPRVEHQSVMQQHQQKPVQVAYLRANRQWLEELCILHNADKAPPQDRLDLFDDFNSLPEGADRTKIYQHKGR